MLFFHSKPLFIDIYFHSSHRYCEPSNSSHPEHHHRRLWHLSLCYFIYFILWHFCFHFPMNYFFLYLTSTQPYPTQYPIVTYHFWFWFEFLSVFWLAKLTQKQKLLIWGLKLLACWVIIGWFPFPNEHIPPLLCFFTRVWLGAQSWTTDVTFIRQLTSTREVKLRPVDCNKSR